MAQLANITVKKNDGTTDIVYTGVQPSAGEGSPAIWQAQTVGSAAAHYPELRTMCRDIQKGSQRQTRGTYKYPQLSTNSTTGLTSVVRSAYGRFEFDVPKDMNSADRAEAASQFCNLIYATLVKEIIRTGFNAN